MLFVKLLKYKIGLRFILIKKGGAHLKSHLSTRIASLGRIVLVATRPLPFPWGQKYKERRYWSQLIRQIDTLKFNLSLKQRSTSKENSLSNSLTGISTTFQGAHLVLLLKNGWNVRNWWFFGHFPWSQIPIRWIYLWARLTNWILLVVQYQLNWDIMPWMDIGKWYLNTYGWPDALVRRSRQPGTTNTVIRISQLVYQMCINYQKTLFLYMVVGISQFLTKNHVFW